MARMFDDAQSEFLYLASVIVNSYPVTLAGWFYSDDLTAGQAIISFGSDSAHFVALIAAGNVALDPVRFSLKNAAAGGQKDAYTTNAYSANTWHHACGRANSATEMDVFIDGGSKGSSIQNEAWPANLARTEIARITTSAVSSTYMSGRLAEVGAWNVALTDAEVAVLALGYSPLFVRPQSLVAYYQLIRDTDNDIVGDHDMTAFNTPTIATHTRVLYPTSPFAAREGAPITGVPHNPLAMTGLSGLGGIIRQIPSGGPAGDARLKEDGDYRLLESGDYRLLE